MKDELLMCFGSCYKDLYELESVVNLTLKSCLNQECNAIYYNINEESSSLLSEERNHYINLLSISLDKVKNLKKEYSKLENNINTL